MAPDSSTVWNEHFASGRDFAPLRTSERELLADRIPLPAGGAALDIGCGTGELSRFLAGLGWAVTAVDFATNALERAASQSANTAGLQLVHLNADRDLGSLPRCAYDLVVTRLSVAFLDRGLFLSQVRHLLRPGATVCVITPTVDSVAKQRRAIALDEAELGDLAAGFAVVERLSAEGFAVLLLRDPLPTHPGVEKLKPAANSLSGVGIVVHNRNADTILVGRSARFPGLMELCGGKIEPGEDLRMTVVRELREETGLVADPATVRLLTVLTDRCGDLPRTTIAAYVGEFTGEPAVTEPHLIAQWLWHPVTAVPGPLFKPSLDVLNAWRPDLFHGGPVHAYPLADTAPTPFVPAARSHPTHTWR